MKDNMPYIAVGLYIAITVLLLFAPKKWVYKIAKKDFGTTEAEWKRKDNIAYYRLLFMVGGFVTILFMLILKYFIL